MAETCPKASCKSYHHGDLRTALILAAAELIEEQGSVDFAMIDAARRAGVSSAAPYRHFKDKDALLAEVVELAFLGLTESGKAALVGQDIGTEQALVALGSSYIRFVLEHKPFYDLMWGEHGSRALKSKDISLKGSAFHVLTDCVKALCEREHIELADPEKMATRLWAMCHGLSTLSMNGQIHKFQPDADVFELLESSTRIFFDGLRRQG